jgi:hypothetical protein
MLALLWLAAAGASPAEAQLESACAVGAGVSNSTNANPLFRLDSMGARAGFPANRSGIGFNQAEFVANWDLPWQWDAGVEWRLQWRLDLSAGWLGSSSADGAIGTLGPTLILERLQFPLSVEGGISPTGLTRFDYGTKNFGSYFQFTSHAGLNCDVTSHVRLSYRFQHMSNAGLSGHNPGLNLHMLGLSYLF